MDLTVNVQSVAEYLGIEHTEIDPVIESNIRRQLSAADRFLRGAIGEDYDTSDPRAQELAIMTVAELYNSRGLLTAKQESSLKRIASDFTRQMRLERRGE